MTSTLIIACGAIAGELAELVRLNEWRGVKIRCLPPELHNTPARIPAAVEQLLQELVPRFDRVLVAYADCGTGGLLDGMLERYGVERLPGAHCYELFAGTAAFHDQHRREPGTFYVTDFLLRHFDRLVIRGLGLDRHPQLRDEYFRHYKRLVYLAQTETPGDDDVARRCAQQLGLAYERLQTGLEPLHGQLRKRLDGAGQWPS